MKTSNPNIVETINCFKPFLIKGDKRSYVNNLCVAGSSQFITDGIALIRWPNMEELEHGAYKTTKIDKKSALLELIDTDRTPPVDKLFDKNPTALDLPVLTPENTVGVIIHHFMLSCPGHSINYKYIDLFLKLFDEVDRVELHGDDDVKRLVLCRGDISMMIMPLTLKY